MEGGVHGDDLMICPAVLIISISSGCLDSAFNGFRTAVGEKYPVQACCPGQSLCCSDCGNIIIIIGGMGQLIDLVFDRIIKILVIVTKSEYRNASAEIKIAFSSMVNS